MALQTSEKKTLILDEYVPYLIRLVGFSISTHFEATTLRRFKLSIADWRVLATVMQLHEPSQANVIAHAGLNKMAVSRSISSLLNGRYLVRRQDPADRRTFLLKLTSKGKSTYNAIAIDALRLEDRLLSDVNTDDLERLKRLLKALYRRVLQFEAD